MEYMPYIWLGLTVIMGIIEVATCQLVSIWFVIGGCITAISSVTFFKDELLWQIILFIVVSAVALILTKPLVKKLKVNKHINTNSDRNIGKSGFVTIDINPKEGTGQVKVGSEVWSAKSSDETYLAKNTEITVIGIEGVKLVVKANNNK